MIPKGDFMIRNIGLNLADGNLQPLFHWKNMGIIVTNKAIAVPEQPSIDAPSNKSGDSWFIDMTLNFKEALAAPNPHAFNPSTEAIV